jgi:hypothetical protein
MLGAKVAMLLQMKRIFVVNRKSSLFLLIEILLWTNCGCYFALMMAFAFDCVPRAKLWNPELPGRCIDPNASLLVSALNVVSDVSMLVIPLVVVSRLQLPRKSKRILSVVFGSGILYVVTLLYSQATLWN